MCQFHYRNGKRLSDYSRLKSCCIVFLDKCSLYAPIERGNILNVCGLVARKFIREPHHGCQIGHICQANTCLLVFNHLYGYFSWDIKHCFFFTYTESSLGGDRNKIRVYSIYTHANKCQYLQIGKSFHNPVLINKSNHPSGI